MVGEKRTAAFMKLQTHGHRSTTIHLSSTILFVMTLWLGSCVLSGDCLVNVARGKPAKQKDDLGSPYPNGNAEWAVDGNSDRNYWAYTCSHTAEHSYPAWWMVDLLGKYEIHAVKLTNRDYAEYRLQQFSLHVSVDNPLQHTNFPNTIPGELCAYHGNVVYGTETINCSVPVYGRYLTIYKANYVSLTMCEVEVLTPSILVLTDFRLLLQNAKSIHSPFHTSGGTASALTCATLCREAPGGAATLFQHNKSSKECECIQYSSLDSSSTGANYNAGWNLYASITN